MRHQLIGAARWLVAGALLVLPLSPVQAERAVDGDSIAAKSGDWVVTYRDLDRRALTQDAAKFQGLRLREAIHEARRAALEALLAEHLLEVEAKRTGESPQALLQRELQSRTTAVADGQVRAWYDANQSRLKGASFDAAAADIRRLLEAQQRERARQDLLDRLRVATPVTLMLEPPREQLRVATDEPAYGPAGAPVEIIMYSDFQCPFCAKVTATIERLKHAYDGKIRIVFRDFPLASIHPQALQAAVAARCAHEQGRFWEYHDQLFAHPRDLAAARLEDYAAILGLDAARFSACRSNERTVAMVRENLASGEQLGLAGTPAFFINGRFLNGAQPYEVFERVIDEELGALRPADGVAPGLQQVTHAARPATSAVTVSGLAAAVRVVP
jgi:protein-disulfide isomerase